MRENLSDIFCSIESSLLSDDPEFDPGTSFEDEAYCITSASHAVFPSASVRCDESGGDLAGLAL